MLIGDWMYAAYLRLKFVCLELNFVVECNYVCYFQLMPNM